MNVLTGKIMTSDTNILVEKKHIGQERLVKYFGMEPKKINSLLFNKSYQCLYTNTVGPRLEF